MVVYLATNLVNGKHYVGKTVRDLKDRWAKHLSKARRGSRTYLHSAIRKHGPDAFSIVPLVTILTTDPQLKEFERLWIRLLRSNERQFGYNLTAGGEGNIDWNPSTETRRNMSEGQAGRIQSTETRRKISDSLEGNSYRKGIPHTAEIRRQIGDTLRGKKRSAETGRKISNALKGRPKPKGRIPSVDHRRKISEALKGRTRSVEHCRKISEAKFIKTVAWG